MIDSKLLEAYVSEVRTKPEIHQQYLPTFHDVLQMHVSILELLQRCVLEDVNFQALLLQDKQAFRQLILLLGIAFDGKFGWQFLVGLVQKLCRCISESSSHGTRKPPSNNYVQIGHRTPLTDGTMQP